MDKLLIIDGSNLLFQMFYGMPSRIVNKDGKAIQGTLGFIGAREIPGIVRYCTGFLQGAEAADSPHSPCNTL